VTTQRKPPARWRKARFPEAGTRWDTPMNRMVWERDHGDDLELWQGEKQLAYIKPGNGGWVWSVSGVPGLRGPEDSPEDAKAAVKQTIAELDAERAVSP
jgi:hypothetical protein